MQEGQIYFNTPAAGIITREGLNLLDRFHNEMMVNPSEGFSNFEVRGYDETKALTAKFLGAEIAETAFVPNFSYGLSCLITSIKNKRNKVLLYKSDYPSVIMAFELLDFEIEWMDPDEFNTETLLAAIDKSDSGILAISHVQYLTGYKLDVESIGKACRAKNMIFILDATQSMGVHDFNFSKLPLDVVISSNYKWMNAGYGSGTLCCSVQFLEEYKPVIGGRNSMRMINGDFVFPRDINSYEPGHLPMHNLLLLREALKVKLSIGKAEIEAHSHSLIRQFISELNHQKYHLVGSHSTTDRAGIVCIRNEDGLFHYLSNHGVVCVERGENVRFGFHYHNTPEEVSKLCELLNSF